MLPVPLDITLMMTGSLLGMAYLGIGLLIMRRGDGLPCGYPHVRGGRR
ncbi:hypothetical protein [Streptomyces halobius]|uniref:Uncharacterized protein n=1 Tax=Streptomyces halobius TaxID=2879846 RepID=A0ABY4M3V0_9ACTN|nr:hypothetical protein [Streptomyces halobius]UQA92363.1 hypothetical protein K9S39_11400 [Streptomyces halobius]